jgi:catechol 2,3-dioxygenase-like lactoylglutathione lyase family enzyme
MTGQYPRAFNHIAVGVPDIDAAIEWYQEVMGFKLFEGPIDLDGKVDPRGQLRDVLGPELRKVRVAHLATANGVGLELFQSIDPPHERREHPIEFWKSGVWHFCVTDPDVDGLTAKIVASGGKQLSKVWQDRLPHADYKMVYCQDPFGTLIEVYSHGYELFRAWR